MTRQQAINQKCRECVYDDQDDGTWRQQVERCDLSDCALYEFRPIATLIMNYITEKIQF